MCPLTKINAEYSGYQHADYAHSFKKYGTPRELTHSKGWVIERTIPNTPYYDAMGCYPLFQCQHWECLPDDLQALGNGELVSLVMVSEPMLDNSMQHIFKHFDIAQPFRAHYFIDLERPLEQSMARRHRRYVGKASKVLDIDIPEQPLTYLDEWCGLYQLMMQRHNCNDIRAFSRESFRQLLSMPGVILFRALKNNQVVGAQIMVLSGEVGYFHLVGFTEEGYKNSVSYFLTWQAMVYFQGRCRFLNQGGGKSLEGNDGLSIFKQGWSTEQRMTYLLGAVLNPTIYTQLSSDDRLKQSNYFPRYRTGEYS